MDPTGAGTALLLTARLVGLAIELDQVPEDIRHCLELVQTCHRDTQHLIEMRNQNVVELQRRPKELERVDDIIITTLKGLQEVSELVEKCRPDANGGQTHLGKRLWWKYVDRDMFQMQLPIVERHHTSVVAELNYVRQLGLLSPAAQAGPQGGGGRHYHQPKAPKTVEFEKLYMLGAFSSDRNDKTGAFKRLFSPPADEEISTYTDIRIVGTGSTGKTPPVPYNPSPVRAQAVTWNGPQNTPIYRGPARINPPPAQAAIQKPPQIVGAWNTSCTTSAPYDQNIAPTPAATWEAPQNPPIHNKTAQMSWPPSQNMLQQPPPPPYTAGPASEELRVMQARVPQVPKQSIYSDPRKSQEITATALKSQMTAMPAPKQLTSMGEDQGLAALLGGFTMIPTSVESTVINQNTNYNAPINITVHVNNYASQHGGPPVTSMGYNVSGGAGYSTAMEVAQAQLQSLSRSSQPPPVPIDYRRQSRPDRFNDPFAAELPG